MKFRLTIVPFIALYLLYAGVMYAKQAAILFPAASDRHHAFESTLPAGAELVEIPVSFGKARAIYWRPKALTAPATAIWLAHGNFETVRDSFTLVQPLVEHGIAVMQFEFPGYDGADGSPNFDGINEAARATYDALATEPDVDRTRIVIAGYSIGGGAAVELAQVRPAAALVLMSTFSSMDDIAHRYLLPAAVVRFPYDNVAGVRAFDGPIFVEHGRRDAVIPFAFGQRLAAAKPGVEFFAQNCGHADCDFANTVFAYRLPAWLAAHRLIPAQSEPRQGSISSPSTLPRGSSHGDIGARVAPYDQ